MGDLEFLFVLLLAATVLVRVADAVGVPYPVVLALGGLGIAFVPGLPDLQLEPEVVFLVFLPPLLHAAGWQASPRELRAEIWPLTLLSLGLVLVTMVAVAIVAHHAIDLPWAAAFVLGAIVAPTDPVSAAATFSRLGVPDRVAVLVEGEAMINDASALVAYRVAVAAVLTGAFSFGEAGLDFVVSALGGVAVGLAVGWLGDQVHRRLNDVPLAIVLTLVFAYGAYIAAEGLGVSGVLGTVTAGLWLGWQAPTHFDPDTRLSGVAFWGVLVFLLNALLFLLLGLQFPRVVEEVQQELSAVSLLTDALLIAGVVIAMRLLVVMAPGVIPGLGRVDTGEDWRERLIVGWSGMRGAVSLAAALSLPVTLDSGATFAQREVVIFVTVAVIALTLVGQGLTLAPLIAALGIQGERPWSPDEALARLEAAQAALDRLEELADDGVDPERLRRLRDLYRLRFRRCMAVIGGDGDRGAQDAGDERTRYSTLRRELIAAERAALLRLRNEGRVAAGIMRTLERELDLEEARLNA